MNKNIIISILLLVCIALSITLYIKYMSDNAFIKETNERVENLKRDNERIEFLLDSINNIIIENMKDHDSLILIIDSSKLKYKDLEIKYKNMKDSVKYLNLDESIYFLLKKLEDT